MKLSVVMPVYNAAAYIREAIESVLRQTHADFELILGDNGSTDDSLVIAEGFGDPRILVIRNAKNLGIFGNLNNLFTRAQGDLIKILCADDVMAADCLEKQSRFLQERPELGFCRARELHNGSKAFSAQARGLDALPAIIAPEAAGLAFFLHGNIPGNLSNVMVRKAVWVECGGFREDLPYSGDFEFWFRAARRHPFGIMAEPLMLIRHHDGQASVRLNTRNELVAQQDVVLELIYDALPDSLRRRGLVRTWGSFIYVSAAIHRAVRLTLAGHLGGWRQVFRPRRYARAFPLSLALYLGSGNRRWGLQYLYRRLGAGLIRPAGTND